MHEKVDRIALAERQESDGNWSDAVKTWGQLALDEHDPQIAVRYARALSRVGRAVDAERVLRDTTKVAIQLADAHFGLGLLFEAQDRLEEARQAFEQGLRVEERQEILTLLGSVQRRLQDLASAERTFRRSLELNPEDDEAHYGLGLALKDSNPLEAVEHLSEAVRIDPTLHRVHRELGYALWRAGQIERAQAALRQAIAADPTDGWAHDYLGHIFSEQDNWRAAKDEFATAAASEPRIGLFWCNLADAHARLGDRVQAERHFRRALSVGMGFPVIDRRYGLFLKAGGRFAKARRYLQRALEQDPADERARTALAELEESTNHR